VGPGDELLDAGDELAARTTGVPTARI
jgi:hypothetical protein